MISHEVLGIVLFFADKIVNATVSPPKLIVENVTSTFTVQFDTSRNQSYGNVQYRWDPGDNSVAQLTYHPVFSHMYKKAGVYHATVEIYNLFLSAPELKKEYEVKVVSGMLNFVNNFKRLFYFMLIVYAALCHFVDLILVIVFVCVLAYVYVFQYIHITRYIHT